jgi:putative peptidoglycan lipid II flippase
MCNDSESAIHIVAAGYLVVGALQFAYLYLCLKSLDRAPSLFSSIKVTARLREFFKRLTPILAGAGVAQINVFVDSLFGSFLQTGGISHIYFADRFIQLPLALFGISIGIVIIPEIVARLAKNVDIQDVTAGALLFALRLTVPSAIVIISLSYQLVSILYGHGQFTESSVQRTADVTRVFAAGLPAYVIARIVSSILFAGKDSRTPVIAGVVSIISNIILNAILINSLQEIGLASATTIAGFINIYVILRIANIKLFAKKQIVIDLFKIIAASLVMFIAIKLLNITLRLGYSKIANEAITIASSSFVGIIAYATSLVLFRDSAVCHMLKRIAERYRKRS